MRTLTRFEHILNSLEHILLVHDNLPENVPPINVVSAARWLALSHERRTDFGFAGTTDPAERDRKFQEISNSMCLIQQGFGHIRDYFRTGGPVLGQFRYWDMRIHSTASSNHYSVNWDICLDILVRGDHVDEGDLSDHSGIYNSDRGRYVDQVVNRFANYPVLDHVKRHDNYPDQDDDEGDNNRRYWLGGGLDDNGVLRSEWPTGWQVLRPSNDLEIADGYPRVTGFSMSDGTDLNYWTLLWAHGAPESYGGYFPTTIKFTITEQHQVGVGSTGGAFG